MKFLKYFREEDIKDFKQFYWKYLAHKKVKNTDKTKNYKNIYQLQKTVTPTGGPAS